MPELQYKGEAVVVANEETTEADWVSDIPPRELFISNANPLGQRFAFSLAEIDAYVKEHNQLVNFYNIPRSAFSVSEMSELIQRSAVIARFIERFVHESQRSASLISAETIHHMAFLVNHSAQVIEDPLFIKEIKQKYTEEELEDLQDNGISIHDLGRGMAFQQFKTHYQTLSAEEQQAIDQFPGVPQQLQHYGLKNSLKTLFQLQGEACLGGSAGICREIIERIKLFERAKEALMQMTPADEVKDSDTEGTIRYRNAL
ncbi:hypothetical protein DIZ81_01260 [Legionella taurinensis]|uniref:Uncharacterized protein n=1 Tax=Legionella taurinensis TaxID=70611 RepID=A0A3A5LLG8_9GAMM|nr:hypothetical protein [Legionella taurinensis]MDX1836493.1 hypothetical protein [Legionella taurinensis]PUT43037.1 hypothetical protein DB744_01265 [Legionella taurinensis]PUT45144.1 hypothetical protein DB743_07285 [Legionella taurinensis]PUT45593.1 hypothetical protein DB746_01265 [Legionella taurinensis]PUT49361.1 hypothetical protein DB745_01265 [Legionella taurinensis]